MGIMFFEITCSMIIKIQYKCEDFWIHILINAFLIKSNEAITVKSDSLDQQG